MLYKNIALWIVIIIINNSFFIIIGNSKKELLNAKDVKEFYNVVQTCNQITKNIILKDFEDAYEGDYSENYAESRTKEYDCFKRKYLNQYVME